MLGARSVPLPSGMTDLLPRWEIDNLFPGLASREMAAAREGMVADISRLGGLFDRHDVRGGPSRPVTSSDGEVLDRVLAELNAVLARLEPLEAYIYALVTTDARDDAATAALTGLQADLVALDGLRTRLDAWVGRLGAADLAAAASSGGDYLHLLERAAADAAHQMAEGEEGLLAELRLSGSNAWSRLAGDIGSTLEGTVDGQRLPVTVLRGRATDPDRAVRHAAYRAELVAWESVATPLAACLNGVKGEAVTVNRRRSWSDALAPALQANGVDAGTLAAMQSAAVATFPHFRRFLRAKARLLSPAAADAGLAWWDLVAPVPGEATVDWSTAAAAVTDAFGTYSSRLGDHARRAIDGGWVDAGPRSGKRGGAYCMPVGGGDSRVLMNFDGSWDSVQTLAHELGHAYHNMNLAARPPLQQHTPMALAETASIFCETVVVNAGLRAAAPGDRLALLNVDLLGSTQVVVDIHSRFLFESALFTRREDGPVSVADLCAEMTAAQRATYGDGVDPATLHPWMWAVKPHYYSADLAFYNWPYCFGLLFGLGLFARFEADPDGFRSGYDDLLASTGTAGSRQLASRFDIDLGDVAFWEASLGVIVGRIDEFVRLVDARQGAAPGGSAA